MLSSDRVEPLGREGKLAVRYNKVPKVGVSLHPSPPLDTGYDMKEKKLVYPRDVTRMLRITISDGHERCSPQVKEAVWDVKLLPIFSKS